MGEADLLKSLLQTRLGGTLHFGRLNMKPGKPTTFATIPRCAPPQPPPQSGGGGGGGGGGGPAAGPAPPPPPSACLMFALPGNPVSCLVCAQLLVAPAIRRLLGFPVAECMPPQLDVRLAQPLKMDPERPEYHRCVVHWASGGGGVAGEPTSTHARARGRGRRPRGCPLGCVQRLGRGVHVIDHGVIVAAGRTQGARSWRRRRACRGPRGCSRCGAPTRWCPSPKVAAWSPPTATSPRC
jgi:hypothetical protein